MRRAIHAVYGKRKKYQLLSELAGITEISSLKRQKRSKIFYDFGMCRNSACRIILMPTRSDLRSRHADAVVNTCVGMKNCVERKEQDKYVCVHGSIIPRKE